MCTLVQLSPILYVGFPDFAAASTPACSYMQARLLVLLCVRSGSTPTFFVLVLHIDDVNVVLSLLFSPVLCSLDGVYVTKSPTLVIYLL